MLRGCSLALDEKLYDNIQEEYTWTRITIFMIERIIYKNYICISIYKNFMIERIIYEYRRELLNHFKFNINFLVFFKYWSLSIFLVFEILLFLPI